MFKRVQKISDHYLLDDNKTIRFFENVEEKSEGRIVPPIIDRIDIINKAHLLGHLRLEKNL